MKAVVAAFNQEKALVGAFSVITNLRICFGWNFLKHCTWLVWGHAVIGEAEVWSQNPAWCRLFNFTMTYFTISTYFWMMCEVEFSNFDIDIRNIGRRPTSH